MNRVRRILVSTDSAYMRGHIVTILSGVGIYPAFVATCHAAQALGWLA